MEPNNTDVQCINLSNISQGETEERGVLRKLEDLFAELQLEIKKRDEENQKLIKALMEQVVALRIEVKELKSVPSVKSDLSLLPALPFASLNAFKEFDDKILFNGEMRNQLNHLINRIVGNDMPSFLKMALKTMITDELAVRLTWSGTADRPSIQKYKSFNIIKEACHSKFKSVSIFDINKVWQQHFLHAKDRVNKLQQKN